MLLVGACARLHLVGRASAVVTAARSRAGKVAKAGRLSSFPRLTELGLWPTKADCLIGPFSPMKAGLEQA
jgi:hypothetical protein